jgi:hypothetical protein
MQGAFTMKYPLLILGALACLGGSPAAAAVAPFGCDARAPSVCHFRIIYARGGRMVVLPAGMKQQIPDVRIGKDHYCVGIDTKPRHKCQRKVINDKYNN